MGFLKKDSDFSSGEHYSVVSAECYFQGTLSVQGSLRVDGTLEGSVDNARHVIVGTDGKILGDVTAQIVVCGGVIEGNVCADMLEVLAPAFIKGDIRAKKMIVEEGGRIEGLCVIGGATEESAEEEQEEDDEDGKKSKK
ncbi:MAG: polymer-forming cytoskeletal protein [Elusimicrobia bacterium]|nr:polymer-forming cytoskeletal protein [Elusimicrobiaceae bacterium]MDD7578004.1 polymer-forming cytoskeletal protein [Elusimicrobiota bacterium]MDY6039690.1 polymer-forming cytoskeletal protein [Elusimicrobiaceae bacterium]